ncbi:MAG: phosphoglycerate kinase [bacterium]
MDRLVIDDLELQGKRVLMRVDFNVPIADGNVVDATRIQATLPTIQKVISDGGKLILISHLGRPGGEVDAKFSLGPVAEKLSELLGSRVRMADDCIGDGVDRMVQELKEGEVLLLENLRFHQGETANDPEFSQKLASHGEVFVNDAFGAAHRAHASTAGVTQHIKEAAAGYLLQSEVTHLTKLLETPQKPYVVILGGAKVSDKLKVIRNLVTRVSTMLIGGGMAYTFLKAKGGEIGDSLLDTERLAMAYNALVVANRPHPYKRVEFILPCDHIVSTASKESESKCTDAATVADGWKGVDIGPKTVAAFKEKILAAKTVFWNGPMGIFEVDNFARGTIEIAKAVAEATERGAFTVIGGGDSVAAIERAGVKEKISHVSTGGGASLEFMAGIDLPGIRALSKAKKKPAPEKAATE